MGNEKMEDFNRDTLEKEIYGVLLFGTEEFLP